MAWLTEDHAGVDVDAMDVVSLQALDNIIVQHFPAWEREFERAMKAMAEECRTMDVVVSVEGSPRPWHRRQRRHGLQSTKPPPSAMALDNCVLTASKKPTKHVQDATADGGGLVD